MDLSSKILCLVGCILLGFVFPLAFIGAAILALGIYVDTTKDHDAPGKALQRSSAGSRDFTEKAQFRRTSESPAEEAFFDAMQKHFNLEVRNGKLVGNESISLDMQIEVLRYRLDFLVDKRLVVEIDGAAWHSSPDAVARDQSRDAELHAAGYQILRIPAKVVFNNPQEAIARVQQARKEVKTEDAVRAEARAKAATRGGTPVGTPVQQIGASLRPKRMLSAVNGAFAGIGRFSDALEEATLKHAQIREKKEADIARVTDPITLESLRKRTDRRLINQLVDEKDYFKLIALLDSDSPDELAKNYLRERADNERRKREHQEWTDDNIPF